MDVMINGENHQVQAGVTVVGLLEHLDLGSATVAVEINKELVRRAEHGEHKIEAGDQIEIVTLVGGG